jgi:periplasmic protein TonB
MNSSAEITKYGNVNDLLFRGKNKAYGAYALRQEYEQRLQRSLFYFILFTALLSASIVTYDYIQNKHKTNVDGIITCPGGETILTQYKPEVLQPKPLEVKVKTIAATPPIIVSDVNDKVETKLLSARSRKV